MQCPFLPHKQQVERFCLNQNCCEKMRLSCNQCHQESFHNGHQKDQKLISYLPSFVEDISTRCEKEIIKMLTDLSDNITQLFFQLKDKIRSQFQISSQRLETLNNNQINQMLCRFTKLDQIKTDLIELEIIVQNLQFALGDQINNLQSNLINYRQLNDQDISEARQYYIQGLTLFQNGNYLKALNAFDTSLMFNPNQIDVMLWKSESLYYSNFFQDALVNFKQVLKLDYSNINSLNGIGNCLFRLELYKEAIIWLDQALEQNPRDVKSLTKKGDCLQKLNDYQEAIIWYQKALVEDPNKFWTLQSKGSCLFEQRKLQQYKNLSNFNKLSHVMNKHQFQIKIIKLLRHRKFIANQSCKNELQQSQIKIYQFRIIVYSLNLFMLIYIQKISFKFSLSSEITTKIIGLKRKVF